MKHAVWAMLVASGCSTSAVRPETAPDFDLRTAEGERIQGFTIWAKKPVLLVFMTAW